MSIRDRLSNTARRWWARLRGRASYLDRHGTVRFARDLRAGDVVEVPMEHIGRVYQGGRVVAEVKRDDEGQR